MARSTTSHCRTFKMDYVLFTLFLMVCQLCQQGNVLGKPANGSDAKTPWPKECEGEIYCSLKPYDYPSVKTLKTLYNAQKHKFDFETQVIKTGNRSGEKICRHYDYFLVNVYMIKDKKNNIRYALHIPGIYDFLVQVKPCKPSANTHLEQKYKDEGMKCIQEYSQRRYIVLSQDKKSLETVNMTLPSFCLPHKTGTTVKI